MEGMVNRHVAALARAWCPPCQEQVRRLVFSPHLQIPLCVQLPALPIAAVSGTLSRASFKAAGECQDQVRRCTARGIRRRGLLTAPHCRVPMEGSAK